MMASTSEVYGDPLIHPQKEDYWGNVNPIGPRGVYDEAKRFAEAMTMAYHRYHGVDTRIVRIFNTYGPRMRPHDGRVVSNLIVQALRGEPLTVYGDGTGDSLFIGGQFSVAGETLVSNIAKWDGSSWAVLGSGMNAGVHALTVFDDGGGPALYAGGDFTLAGGVGKQLAVQTPGRNSIPSHSRSSTTGAASTTNGNGRTTASG